MKEWLVFCLKEFGELIQSEIILLLLDANILIIFSLIKIYSVIVQAGTWYSFPSFITHASICLHNCSLHLFMITICQAFPNHNIEMNTFNPHNNLCVAHLCLTLCNPMDFSPPGSSVHGIVLARILEWVAISSSRGFSWPRDWTHVSCIGRWILYHWATWEASNLWVRYYYYPHLTDKETDPEK